MNRKLVVLAMVVVASGCMHSEAVSDLPSNSNPNPTSSSSGGLQVSTFDISDDALGPGQSGIITVELANNHPQDIQLDDLSLYNTGVLEIEKMGCTPSEFAEPREDYTPRMECTWRVNVPESAVENFDSKTIPIKLNLEYDSQLSNTREPVKTHFLPLEEITSTNQVAASFSNGEVQMNIETERPIPFAGRTVSITARNAGNGRVASNFTFEYFPEGVFDGCDPEYEPVVDQEVEFSCSIVPQSEAEQTRNLIVSTSYKYVKSPTLDIRVVDTP